MTQSYFGPDRRRQQIGSVNPDRRVIKTEDTDIFDSPRDPSALDLQEGHVCFFLNEKLSKGKIYLVAQGPTKLAPSGS